MDYIIKLLIEVGITSMVCAVFFFVFYRLINSRNVDEDEEEYENAEDYEDDNWKGINK